MIAAQKPTAAVFRDLRQAAIHRLGFAPGYGEPVSSQTRAYRISEARDHIAYARRERLRSNIQNRLP